MPPVFFPPLLLPQSKLTVLFHFTFLPAAFMARLLSGFLLELERLLGFCPNAAGCGFAPDQALHPFGCDMLFGTHTGRKRRTELQRGPAFEQKVVDFLILWLSAESDFADRILSVIAFV